MGWGHTTLKDGTIMTVSNIIPTPRCHAVLYCNHCWDGQWCILACHCGCPSLLQQVEQNIVIVCRCRSFSSSRGVRIIGVISSRASCTSTSFHAARSRTSVGCNGAELWTHVRRDVKSSTVQHWCNSRPAGVVTFCCYWHLQLFVKLHETVEQLILGYLLCSN